MSQGTQTITMGAGSTQKRVKYNANQRLNSKTIGSIYGLEDDLVNLPESIIMTLRDLFDASITDKILFGGTVLSFTSSVINTRRASLILNNNIYSIEPLAITPTPAGYWGIIEIELEQIDSDSASLQFFDVSAGNKYQANATQRKSFNVKIFEKYDTSAAYPSVTAGRIEWLRFKKDAAFGNIIEVTKTAMDSIFFPKAKSGTVALIEDVKNNRLGEFFHYSKHPSLCPPSASFPNLCISRLHPADSKTATLLQANWAPLVPELRSQTLFFGASDAIDYSGFTPGNPTIIQLDVSGSKNTDVNDPLIELLNLMVRYHDSIDFATSILSANWTSLNLVCSFNGSDYRIIDFDAINRTITIDYDSTSDTSAPGTIKIYPHRIRTSDANSSTTAQIRKLKPETTLASGYQSGILLPHQFQGHETKILNGSSLQIFGFDGYSSGAEHQKLAGGGSGFNESFSLRFYSDGTNGTPQMGKTTRSNQLGTYIYIAGGSFTP